jgi:hypothetical protein
LADAHWDIPLYYLEGSEKTNYWKRPDVWPDIQAAYERFFDANPNETGRYYQYAWYAYHCDQWAKFIELLPKLEPVNFDYFGGKDEFDKMAQLAKENSGKPK